MVVVEAMATVEQALAKQAESVPIEATVTVAQFSATFAAVVSVPQDTALVAVSSSSPPRSIGDL